MLLLPVPSLKSEFVIITLLALVSKMSPSVNTESVISTFERSELVISPESKVESSIAD